MQTELFTLKEIDNMDTEIDNKLDKKTTEDEIKDFHERAEENRQYRKSLRRRRSNK